MDKFKEWKKKYVDKDDGMNKATQAAKARQAKDGAKTDDEEEFYERKRKALTDQ